MNFTIVILDEHVTAYPQLEWSDWKDENRKQMISQGIIGPRAPWQVMTSGIALKGIKLTPIMSCSVLNQNN